MIAIVSAPTNLGMRPPVRGAVPGTAKAPEALRQTGLYRRLAQRGAIDAGTVLPGRYLDDDEVRPTTLMRNQAAMIDHSRRLAAVVRAVRADGLRPVVLGGDCSLMLGIGLGLRGAADQRPGLIDLDGHTDFRHPGNTERCASLGGEVLAASVVLHLPELSRIDGYGPYFDSARTVQVGCREDASTCWRQARRSGWSAPRPRWSGTDPRTLLGECGARSG